MKKSKQSFTEAQGLSCSHWPYTSSFKEYITSVHCTLHVQYVHFNLYLHLQRRQMYSEKSSLQLFPYSEKSSLQLFPSKKLLSHESPLNLVSFHKDM